MNDDSTPIGTEQPQQRRVRALKQPRSYTPQHYDHVATGGVRIGGSAATFGTRNLNPAGTANLIQGPITLTATGTFRPAIRPAGGEMMISERKRNAGGQPPGQTHHPDFLRTVVEAVIELRSLDEKAPSADIIAGRLGVSRSSYFAWLRDNRLNSADIKIAASSRTILDGVARLVSLQQKRRQQRV